MFRRWVTGFAVVGLAIPVAVAGTAYADEPGITPKEVEAMILPGYDYQVEKTVTTAAIPPEVEVCLLEDETGSYFDDIENLKAAAQDIYDAVTAGTSSAEFAVAGFRDYPVSPFGEGGDWVYRLLSSMSAAEADWLAGVNALTAGGGADEPEAQYDAIVAALVGGFGYDGCGFSPDPDVARVLLVATDAPFHLPGAGKPHVNDEASTITALTAADVTVIGLKAPGAGPELDALAAATGGSVQALSSDGAGIAAAILAGLGNLPVEVEMTSDCEYPISTTFGPENPTTVTSGDAAIFTETISVAADAPGGVYECTDYVWFNGVQQEFVETKTILVPENFVTGGGNITDGKGKNRLNLLTFGGNAGYMADGTLLGHWNFNFHFVGWRFQAQEITALQFVDTGVDPAPPEADADTAIMTAEGRGNFGDGWIDGCTIEVTFHDGGEPQQDGLSDISMSCPGYAVVGSVDLTGGNIQIHDGTKG